MAYGQTNSRPAAGCSSFDTELSFGLNVVAGSPTDPRELYSSVTAVEGSLTEQALSQDDVPADVCMVADNFTDLGDALASFFATETEQPALLHGSPRGSNESSVTSVSIASSSSYEDLAPVAGEKIAELAGLGDGDSTTSLQPHSSDSDEESTSDDKKSNKIIKLPQRKGGMQLWQFLYALLCDSQHKYLIEWTANVREREFRLHEPEAVAIWWGEHKNKRNMSYDKLSRSLRYYYDKGIIRKINGQRYVYRFCVDPEVMYRHIGNSDCRPKLKPMSLAVQHALSTYNTTCQQGMMYPGHPLSSQPLPPTAFTGQYPPHHCSHSYPPVTFAPSFCLPQCGGEYSSYPPMTSYSDSGPQFQPHLLSPVKRFSSHPQPTYPMQEPISSALGQFQPWTGEDVSFPSFMSESTPSPQPISPCSLQSGPQLSPRDHSPLTSPLPPPPPPPPPYSCWDSLPLHANNLL